MNVDFEEKYFCAANTGEGFLSYYGELISAAERVFIIKGGPGTGKSRFLREVAKRAESKGERVVYYYCSSDPSSLDAVFIGGKTLLLDGTALAEGTGYTYAITEGDFATVPGVITVPAATYTQDPVSGVWSVTPGTTVLTVTGTI